MPTLLEKAQEARAGLDKVRQANQVRHQLSAIQSRSLEWQKSKQKHAQLVTKSRYLETPQNAIAELAKADEATRGLCAEARERLSEAENIDVLSQNDLWVRLLQQAERANTLCTDAIRSSWRALIQDLGTVETSSALAAREPVTPSNEKALARYRELYSEYASLKQADMPATAESAAKLRSCVEQLREILSTLTPMPDSVKLFFKAVESGGAALEMLTDEVLNWLKKHDDATRFVVKTRAVAIWR